MHDTSVLLVTIMVKSGACVQVLSTQETYEGGADGCSRLLYSLYRERQSQN